MLTNLLIVFNFRDCKFEQFVFYSYNFIIAIILSMQYLNPSLGRNSPLLENRYKVVMREDTKLEKDYIVWIIIVTPIYLQFIAFIFCHAIDM